MNMKEIFLSWGLLILSVLFNVYGVFVIKLKMNSLGAVKFDSLRTAFGYFFLLLKSPLVAGGLVLFFVAPFLFAMALSRMEMTVAYPVQVGLNFLLLIILAYLVLGEQLGGLKLLGIILIAIGIVFLYLKG